METSLLNEGLALMYVGMGTVFVFLTVLVVAMSLMSAAILTMTKSAPNDDISNEEVAAITAAIAQHRKGSGT